MVRDSSAIAPVLLVLLLVVSGIWALDNTIPGQTLKCRVMNDLSACVHVAMTGPGAPAAIPSSPPPSESPEQRVARLALEAQQRLDADIITASFSVGIAIDNLTENADALTSAASDMAGAVKDVSLSANSGMKRAYAEVKAKTGVRPMDKSARSDVCSALDGVDDARSDVDSQIEGFDSAKDAYVSALSDRAGYVSSLRAAVVELETAVAADNGGVIPEHTATDSDAAVTSAESAAKAAATYAAKAISDVKALVKTAGSWVAKSRKVAVTVASC